MRRSTDGLRAGDPVSAFVRAESVEIAVQRPETGNWVEGEIVERAFVGAYCRFHLRAPGLESVLIADVETGRARGIRPDQKAFFTWDPAVTILVRRGEPAAGRG